MARQHTAPLLAMRSLVGSRVINLDGEDLGKVEEFMLDMDSGRVTHIIMSSGGFWGLGSRLMAVPLAALIISAEEKTFYLNVQKESLINDSQNGWQDAYHKNEDDFF